MRYDQENNSAKRFPHVYKKPIKKTFFKSLDEYLHIQGKIPARSDNIHFLIINFFYFIAV